MPDIVLNAITYQSYSSEAEADSYLAADPLRATLWGTRSADSKKQGLITATRVLQRMCWTAGEAPSTLEPPLVAQPIKDATAVLAADILSTPALGSQPGAVGGIKRAKAGSAEVEFFFSDAQPLPLPVAAYDILAAAGLLCGTGGDGGDTAATITGNCYPSRFEDCRPYPPEIESYYG